MELAYDKGNQLVQVIVQEDGKHLTQSYRYDAFGRRLAKYNDPNNIGEAEESGTDYFGWDGDRLIHTERLNETNKTDEQRIPQPLRGLRA
jgi:YD repeat-containing protein